MPQPRPHPQAQTQAQAHAQSPASAAVSPLTRCDVSRSSSRRARRSARRKTPRCAYRCTSACTSAPLRPARCPAPPYTSTPAHLHLPTRLHPINAAPAHQPTSPPPHHPTTAPRLQVQALTRRLEALAHASTESHPSDCAYWVERGKRLDFVGASAVRPAFDRVWAKAPPANAAVPAAAAGRSARPSVPVLPPVDAASTDIAMPTKLSADSAAVAAAKVRARARAAPPPPAARSRSKPQGGRPPKPTAPSSAPPVALSGDV